MMRTPIRPLPSAAFAVAFATLLFPIAGAAAKQVQLEASIAQPVMLAGEKKISYLKVGLTGFEFSAEGSQRPPANVAIVLDKSGSMGGDKIARAKEAAKMAIDRLGKDDIVSIITYDSTVRVVVPATKVSDKAVIFKMVDAIKPGGNTALFAGVSKGAAELRKFRGKEFVNRIILVSDGIANLGPSTPGALGDLGLSLRKEGISVSTVGLGSRYNEDLMFALADRSDGNHAFAESGAQLATILDGEFGDVLSVVAQEVLVRIDCQPGVRPVRVLGREAEISGQTTTVLLNQLYSKQEKYVLLEVEVPAGKAKSARDIAKVEVSYANMATKLTDELTSKVAVRFTESSVDVAGNEDNATKVASVMQIATLNNMKAMKLRDEGKISEAKEVLTANWGFCLENASQLNCAELGVFAENNRIDSTKLSSSDWVDTRKAMRADQYKNSKQVMSRAYNDRAGANVQLNEAELKKYRDEARAAASKIDQIEAVPQRRTK